MGEVLNFSTVGFINLTTNIHNVEKDDVFNNTTASNIHNATSGDIFSNDTNLSNENKVIRFLSAFMPVVFPGMCAQMVAFYCLSENRDKKMNMINRLFLVLCIIDALGLCAVTVHHVINNFVNNPSTLTCAFNNFFMCVLPLSSGAVTTLMSVERCLKFRAPYWYSVNIWSKKVKVPVIMTTGVFVIVGLFPVCGLGYIVSEQEPRKCIAFPTTGQMYNSPKGVYTLAYAVVGMITVAVDVACNIAVIVTLIGMSDDKEHVHKADVARKEKSPEVEMAKMLLWLSLGFMITLSPLYVSLVFMYAGFIFPPGLKAATHILAGLSFTLDPFIYIFTLGTYKRSAKKLFCGCCVRIFNRQSAQTLELQGSCSVIAT